mgnify:CR=1 FL=1
MPVPRTTRPLLSGPRRVSPAAPSPLAPAPAPLDAGHWVAAGGYVRETLPVRVLQFGTGMLLRALPLALLDQANRAGHRAGRALLVQSTGGPAAATLAAQDGLYTLLARGLVDGAPVDEARLVGSVAAALPADGAWAAIVATATDPALRACVSNVTEGAFRLDERDAEAARRHADGRAPRAFVGKLAALVHARFEALGDGAPSLVAIPTELVDDNGPVLQAMLHEVAAHFPRPDAFRRWLDARVACCSSLVDRITTGAPAPDEEEGLSRRLGYRDALLTVTEPFAFWAVEGDPARLHEALPIDVAAGDAVRYAPSIADARERKLRLLNGAHTTLAPLALLLGHATVAAAMADARVATLLARLLDDELVPTLATVAPDDAHRFARAVRDRFANPSLAHAWRVIVQNQSIKLRVRVAPALRAQLAQGRTPLVLALGLAAHWARLRHEGASDADPAAADAQAHLAGVAAGDVEAMMRAAAALLGDEAAWGGALPAPDAFASLVATLVVAIERDGAAAVVARVASGEPHAAGVVA